MRREEAERAAPEWRKGYQRGFRDAREQADRERAVMAGEDPTKYLFVGGPADGKHIQTGGRFSWRVIDAPPIEVQWVDAPYERRQSSRGFAFYVYVGTR